jgi:hypothetical protein
MITPAIFILACGNLLSSAQVRVGRIVDRARALIVELESTTAPAEREFVIGQLDLYRRRSMALERAMGFLYGSIACFVVSSLLVALTVVLPQLVILPTITTVAGAVLVLAGAMNALAEMRMANGLLRAEIERRCR